MSIKVLSKNENETKKIAKNLAQKILKREIKERIIALVGDLGGGKTTFLKGFARGLGIRKKILSPTFVIMRRYKIPKRKSFPKLEFDNFYHIDCYRLKKPKEILNLGFKKIIKSPKNIVAIEWAEKIKKLLPPEAIWLKFKIVDKKTREILIKDKIKTKFDVA